MVRMLGRRIADMTCLVVATYRDDLAGDHALRIVLGDLAANSSDQTAPACARSRVRRSPSLAAHVRGRPACVSIRSAAAIRSSSREMLAGGGDTLPQTVRDAVFARSPRLPEPAEGVAGRRSRHPSERGAVAARGDRRGRDGVLEACVASGVMVTTNGLAIMFRHETRPRRDGGLAANATASRRPSPCARCADRRSRSIRSLLPRLAHHADAAGDRSGGPPLRAGAARRAAAVGTHTRGGDAVRAALQLRRRPRAAREAASYSREFSVECHLTDRGDAAIKALERLDRDLSDARRPTRGGGHTARIVEHHVVPRPSGP